MIKEFYAILLYVRSGTSLEKGLYVDALNLLERAILLAGKRYEKAGLFGWDLRGAQCSAFGKMQDKFQTFEYRARDKIGRCGRINNTEKAYLESYLGLLREQLFDNGSDRDPAVRFDLTRVDDVRPLYKREYPIEELPHS